MRILVCIDDTDNIDSRGTGDLASMIARSIRERGWGQPKGITRHQLFVHPDIPYTSHNSSMCFEAEMEERFLSELIRYASDFLEKESAEGSDPGLCVAEAEKAGSSLLLEFGKKCKREIVIKQEAYDVAENAGVHLSEHGGTGQGVIGALAGVGLRMSGNDGRFKGKISFETDRGMATAAQILSGTFIERVRDIHGSYLEGNETILFEDALKAVLLDGKPTLLVFPKPEGADGRNAWQVCSKQYLKAF